MSRPVNFRDDGVLWLINRALFHRVGYALAVDEDGDFHLLGDGQEEWQFPSEMSREAEIRAVIGDAAVDRLLTRAGPESERRPLTTKPALGRDMAIALCEKVGLDPNEVAEVTVTASPDDLVRIHLTKLATEDEAALVLSYVAKMWEVKP